MVTLQLSILFVLFDIIMVVAVVDAKIVILIRVAVIVVEVVVLIPFLSAADLEKDICVFIQSNSTKMSAIGPKCSCNDLHEATLLRF